jgi:phosphoribosylaminoimidazolecarboxamide formyltransferase/IMP cyclohydrolase
MGRWVGPHGASMANDLARVGRALISVSDKAGLGELASALSALGVELISTGGTAKALAGAGFKVRDAAELTGYPEMMDGRVKTLHPIIHAGLLAVRENPVHEAAMLAHNIAPIDLLIVNLYPFEETLRRGGAFEEMIENIDIGGPARRREKSRRRRRRRRAEPVQQPDRGASAPQRRDLLKVSPRPGAARLRAHRRL